MTGAQECRRRKVPFLSYIELKIDIFVACASFAAVVEGLCREVSRGLSRAVDDLCVP